MTTGYQLPVTSYSTPVSPTWCPGCGNFMVLAALKSAFVGLGLPPHQIVVAHDIGCSGNMADFLKTYGLHTLHGRVVPVAIGVKLSNPTLTVCCFGGDGGLYGEGLSHLIAAARSDFDINVFVANNQLYSLTTGQASPTTPKGIPTKSTPFGTPSLAVDAIKLIKSVNPQVFAKSINSGNINQLKTAIVDALKHPGFSLLQIDQFCLAFGKQISSTPTSAGRK